MCNWQRVEDGLPPLLPIGSSEELLLMYTATTRHRLALGIYNSIEKRWKSYGETLNDVTHWATVELPGE